MINLKLTEKGLKAFLSGRLWLERSDLAVWPDEPPGTEVRLLSPEGYFLARGYFHPESRIPVRIFSREDEPLGRPFLLKVLRQALEWRQRLYPEEKAFRLVHGEGDGLPGLTVDIYGQTAVIQVSTFGMERVKGEIVRALREILPLSTVVFKNDLPVRREEGLDLYVEVAFGRVSGPVEIRMDGLRFLIDPLEGQKTGFFLDQRENRRIIRRLSREAVVLDLFSYTGAFGLYALSGGARRVFAVDRSQRALELAEEMARLNGFRDRLFPIKARVEEFLRDAPDASVIILDPPAFIKSYRSLKAGHKKYREVNRLAIRALARGFFFTSSCSQFLTADDLYGIVRSVGKQKSLRLLFRHFQAPDHPENPAHPETLYLKGFTFWVE